MRGAATLPGDTLTHRRLELILLVTERCNFRCTYCYEQFGHGRMEPAVVKGVKRLLSTRAGELDFLRLAWFGGEPLLARGVIRDLMGHARSLCRSHTRLHLYSDMATNGWLLTRRVFDEMVDLGVTTFQVTFDGPREWHDRRRLRIDGRGSFDRIWANLQSVHLSTRHALIQVRVHVDGENQADIPRFLESFEAEFGKDSRFILFIRPVSRLGGCGDEQFDFLDADSDAGATADLRRQADRCGLDQIGDEQLSPICYAARANTLVIRADGRVNKCTVALERPENQVGRIDVRGKLALDQELMRTWIRGVISGDDDALSCPMNDFPRITM